MPYENHELEHIINGLTENLNFLLEQAQKLVDRECIFAQKVQFAREQYQLLANKYTSTDPEISSIYNTFEFPLFESIEINSNFTLAPQSEHIPISELTTVVENFRLAAQKLTKFYDRLDGSTLRTKNLSRASECIEDTMEQKSQSTIIEKDFTVPGKKSSLNCPFSHEPRKLKSVNKCSQLQINIEPHFTTENRNSTSHDKQDPICAALYAETKNVSHSTKANSKCPIRFLGQHSPEEVARYFETHKHEIPRSHEICLKRQQKNEDHIRKLDAKYGNLVSVIEVLGQKHQPLLPDDQEKQEMKHPFNERLEIWANDVSAKVNTHQDEIYKSMNNDDRESRFNESLKEVRVGESPSRPWGISVPIPTPKECQRIKSPSLAQISNVNENKFTKIPLKDKDEIEPSNQRFSTEEPLCCRHSTFNDATQNFDEEPPTVSYPFYQTNREKVAYSSPHISGVKRDQPKFTSSPTFLNPSSVRMPRMVFTGPVFIEYPTEEAVKIMQKLNES